MGKPITIGQSHAIAAALLANVNWELLDGDLLQRQVVDVPAKAGKEFTRFLMNGGRMPVGDLKIATLPFDLASFIGDGWQEIAKERDERSAKLTEVDLAHARFVSCLREGENLVKGEEKLRRLKESKGIRLGANVFMGLWNDYLANKEKSILERLHQAGLIGNYVDFFGTVFLGPNGNRNVLCLYRSGDGRWDWNVYWLGSGWNGRSLSAVSQQV